MLLPSDIARLVLGYLQEEGLSSTTRTFILESHNLKEYAEHSTEDGSIPACVYSLFGNNLTTILNEYVAAKTKETHHEVPVMMTSLWKKLDFTLNQIKSLQNSPALAACQRSRSRSAVANMRRQQQALTDVPNSSVICSSAPITPMQTSNNMLGLSTPISLASGTHLQIQCPVSRLSPVHIIVPDQRITQGPLSPGRRKWDSPRRRGSGQSGSSGTGRTSMAVSSLAVEAQPEEAGDENFPQLVIENAREKILGDRSLQEKLAENINKILASDPTPQTSKAMCSAVDPDQSIDEILGLQGEIHMSDDAIHDILEQTESDPAFQALFDLFECNRSRITEGEPGGGDLNTIPEESDSAQPPSADRPCHNDPGGTQREAASGLDPAPGKVRSTQETKARKTRKSVAPSSSKKVNLCPTGKSRLENTSARLIKLGPAPATVHPKTIELDPAVTASDVAAPMDVDEPLNALPPHLPTLEHATEGRASTSSACSAPATAPPVDNVSEPPAAETTSICNVNQVPQNQATLDSRKDSQEKTNEQRDVGTGPPPTAPVTSVSAALPDESTKAPLQTANLSPAKETGSYIQRSPQQMASSPKTSVSISAPATPIPPSADPSTSSKGAVDGSNIVSLQIIISDDEEPPSCDKALTRAISSISAEKIPTIFLSSPARSPAKALVEVPGTPHQDETARAVSCLQTSEVLQPTALEVTAVCGKPSVATTMAIAGTSQAQPSYVIQLPVDSASPGLPAATASYILVTDPSAADPQARRLLVSAGLSQGSPLPSSQYSLATPPRAQGYPTGSALVLRSPVQPMMLPLSVIGQNTDGKFQMVSNQLFAMPSKVPIQQLETIKPKSTVTLKKSAVSGTADQTMANKIGQPPQLSAESHSLLKVPAGSSPSHRRMLCFSSAETPPLRSTQTTASITELATHSVVSSCVQLPEKAKLQRVSRTKPAILTGNKPKRKTEPMSSTGDRQAGLVKETESPQPPQQQHNESARKTPRKQDHKILNQKSQFADATTVDMAQSSSKSELGRRSKSLDKGRSKKEDDRANTKDTHQSRAPSADSTSKSGSGKEGEDGDQRETSEKAPAKSREGRQEKRGSSQESPSVTANKENEVEGSRSEQQARALIPPPATPSTMAPQPSKTPSKTSSLAKQAAEMLQDIQGLNPSSSPARKSGAASSDLPLPRTPRPGRIQEDFIDCPRTPRTPARQRPNGEGTPRRLVPPATPELPTCSPASETGSENSINMAAHTLMILSRAAIARTGTPLKDSLRQEGVGEKSPTTSKQSKKRKQSTTPSSPPAKKEMKRSSSSKKKEKKQKKVLDCFPDDLDVDKFLSSLHYDE